MNNLKNHTISLEETIKANEIVKRYIHQTPLIYYPSISKLIDANVYVKHENHNPGGSFKIRGGINIIHHIKQAGIKGVITFSTGNHGISIATAARYYGIKAVVVVPIGNNTEKNDLIKGLGAELVEAGKDFEEARKMVEIISRERNLYAIHAANEPHLINGVGTEFLEIYNELPDIDYIILPIGGGSEIAAAVSVLKRVNSKIKIIAVQAEKSKAAYESWKANKIVQCSNETFAGGFATGSGYEIPFEIYKNSLDDFILLSEEEIMKGVRLSIKHTKNLAEGAGAAPLIAATKIKEKLKNKNVVLQMSGCNIQFNQLKNILNEK